MLLVSIIIPVYNTELYLRRCLDSVISQTYPNLEIILVDDGSTDCSSTICEEYTSKDTRIKVFHQDNRGSALSRKFAIDISKGDYILMVDSDDWVEKAMVEKMLAQAIEKSLDVVWCDVMIQMRHSQTIHHIKFDHDPAEMLKSIYQGQVPGWFCNKLIRSSLLDDLIAYKDSVLEDIFFSTQLLLKNPQMGYVAEPLYNYNRTNSTALTANKNVAIKGIPNILRCYDYLIEHNCIEDYRSSLMTFILKIKIAFINDKRLIDAQTFFPSAHKNIRNYPIKFPNSLIYWIGMNFGVIGRQFLNLYLYIVR